jgi:hypothetical protein
MLTGNVSERHDDNEEEERDLRIRYRRQWRESEQLQKKKVINYIKC